MEKIRFFGVKSWFFTRNTPKVFAPPSAWRIFSSPDPKGHVRYCHHLASVVRPLTFHILIYPSETTGPNLAESIYIRSSIKFLHFVPFRQQIWPPRAILVSDWLMLKKIFSSETVWPNGAKLGRKHLCKLLYKTSSFSSIRPTNMAAVRTYGKHAKKSQPKIPVDPLRHSLVVKSLKQIS